MVGCPPPVQPVMHQGTLSREGCCISNQLFFSTTHHNRKPKSTAASCSTPSCTRMSSSAQSRKGSKTTSRTTCCTGYGGRNHTTPPPPRPPLKVPHCRKEGLTLTLCFAFLGVNLSGEGHLQATGLPIVLFILLTLSPLETMNFTPLHKIVKEVREFIFRYFTLKK